MSRSPSNKLTEREQYLASIIAKRINDLWRKPTKQQKRDRKRTEDLLSSYQDIVTPPIKLASEQATLSMRIVGPQPQMTIERTSAPLLSSQRPFYTPLVTGISLNKTALTYVDCG